jgi:4-hydroxy-tetrahydrodipicolinate synthase
MLYAFFGADGGLDREAMRRQVDFCVEAGAHGVAALGLATEVGKLSPRERRQVLEWVAEDLYGRLPLAITVFGDTVDEQSAFVRAAEATGADWVILQPPRIDGLTESACLRFFAAVMERSAVPVAIQNAPEYIGIGLSAEDIEALRRDHPNFTLLKAEGSAVSIKQMIEATAGRLAVFNGRNGLELPDNLRAGCAGVIPGAETCGTQSRIFELMRRGDPDSEGEAERLYRDILPMLTFVIQSLETLHCYGKRIMARRLGLKRVYDRAPGLCPSDFGLACTERYAGLLETP